MLFNVAPVERPPSACSVRSADLDASAVISAVCGDVRTSPSGNLYYPNAGEIMVHYARPYDVIIICHSCLLFNVYALIMGATSSGIYVSSTHVLVTYPSEQVIDRSIDRLDPAVLVPATVWGDRPAVPKLTVPALPQLSGMRFMAIETIDLPYSWHRMPLATGCLWASHYAMGMTTALTTDTAGPNLSYPMVPRTTSMPTLAGRAGNRHLIWMPGCDVVVY